MREFREVTKAEIDMEKLEKALRDCTDSGMRRLIEFWLANAKRQAESPQ